MEQRRLKMIFQLQIRRYAGRSPGPLFVLIRLRLKHVEQQSSNLLCAAPPVFSLLLQSVKCRLLTSARSEREKWKWKCLTTDLCSCIFYTPVLSVWRGCIWTRARLWLDVTLAEPERSPVSTEMLFHVGLLCWKALMAFFFFPAAVNAVFQFSSKQRKPRVSSLIYSMGSNLFSLACDCFFSSRKTTLCHFNAS